MLVCGCRDIVHFFVSHPTPAAPYPIQHELHSFFRTGSLPSPGSQEVRGPSGTDSRWGRRCLSSGAGSSIASGDNVDEALWNHAFERPISCQEVGRRTSSVDKRSSMVTARSPGGSSATAPSVVPPPPSQPRWTPPLYVSHGAAASAENAHGRRRRLWPQRSGGFMAVFENQNL